MRTERVLPARYGQFFAPGSWLRTWVVTALIGNGLLALLFVAYEIVERLWLLDRYPIKTLFLFHIYRGVGSSILIGSWAFYNIWRLWRHYDSAFAAAYGKLEQAFCARTSELERAHLFNDQVFDAMHDLIVVIDRDGRLVKANRVGLKRCGSSRIGQCCPTTSAACCDSPSLAERTIRLGAPVIGHIRHSRDDSPRIFSVDAYPLSGSNGPMAIVIERDITMQEHLHAQLRNQEKLAALGVLSAGIAHDIANPLSCISSELDIMDPGGKPEHIRASQRVLHDHVDRIGRVLREMTDFARRRKEELADVPVSVAIEDAMRLVRHDPRARKITLKTELQGDYVVRIVEDHLVMALVNLIINAFDAMPDGGLITVRAEPVRGHVRVSVRDSGHGMTADVLRRATEPLFTTKAPGRGTGLGLAIAQDVVTRAGGALDIDSSPGLGTVVHLTLPLPQTASEVAYA